jgi:hypothetical protein
VESKSIQTSTHAHTHTYLLQRVPLLPALLLGPLASPGPGLLRGRQHRTEPLLQLARAARAPAAFKTADTAATATRVTVTTPAQAVLPASAALTLTLPRVGILPLFQGPPAVGVVVLVVADAALLRRSELSPLLRSSDGDDGDDDDDDDADDDESNAAATGAAPFLTSTDRTRTTTGGCRWPHCRSTSAAQYSAVRSA